MVLNIILWELTEMEKEGSKIMKCTIWLCVFLSFLNLIPTYCYIVQASQITWYVSPAGSDHSGDGSFGNPYRSIQKAMNMSRNGDVIYLRKGNYNNIWESISGTTSGWEIRRSGLSTVQPFVIETYPGDLPAQAVLDGSGYRFDEAYGILTVGRLGTYYSNVTIKDLTFKNSSKEGLTAYASSTYPGSCNNIIIDNCTFYNITERALWFYKESSTSKNNFNHIIVEYCTFDTIQNDASMAEGITFDGCNNSIFRYNYCNDIRKINVVFGNGCHYCEIYKNRINMESHHSGEGIYIDSQTYNGKTCSWIRIHNNTIWGYAEAGSGNYGIAVCAENAGGHVHNITIENNIINRTGPDGASEVYAIGIKHGNFISDITIKHNTIYSYTIDSACINSYHNDGDNWKRIIIANNIFLMTGNSAYCIKFTTLPSTQTNISFYNNCYYRTDGTTRYHIYTDTTTTGEATKIAANPQCISSSTGDFHLLATSPCIGTASTSYTVSYDSDGITRPQNGGYDIGAYEYFSTIENNIVFSMPPNWDINIDGYCNILDLLHIAFHLGQSGQNGWIREDFDKNGRIQILDLVLVSHHLGESW